MGKNLEGKVMTSVLEGLRLRCLCFIPVEPISRPVSHLTVPLPGIFNPHFQKQRSSSTFQINETSLIPPLFAWDGGDGHRCGSSGLYCGNVWHTLLSSLRHIYIPPLHDSKCDLLFPNPWNNCPIYHSLKIDQDLITSQPNSRTLLETSLTVQWPTRTEI